MLCEHEGCGCETETVEWEGKRFCSEWCATAASEGEEVEPCDCGHAECEEGAEALDAR